VEKRTNLLSVNGEDEMGEGIERGVVAENAICIDCGTCESHSDIQLLVFGVKGCILPCYVYGEWVSMTFVRHQIE
jgi:hypothetical protein